MALGQLKLKYSLITTLLLSLLIPLLIGFYFLVSNVTHQHKMQVKESLEAITQIAKLRILASVEQIKETTALVSSRTQLRRSLALHIQTISNSPSLSQSHLNNVNKIIQDAALAINNLEEITIMDNQGNVIATTLSVSHTEIDISAITLPHITLSNDQGVTLLSGFDPLMLDGERIGVIKVSVRPGFIEEIVSGGSDLGNTGEWVLAIKDENGDAIVVSQTLFENKGAFNRKIAKTDTHIPMKSAINGIETFMWESTDYAGNRITAATASIPEFEWGIVAKLNHDEVIQDTNTIARLFWWVLLAVVVIALTIGIILSHFIAYPIESLTKQIKAIEVGTEDSFKQRLSVEDSWTEVAILAHQFNNMLDAIEELNADLNIKVLSRTAELGSSNRQLNLQKQKAEHATKAKTIFLANMSHELRTPLNSIYGSLQLLAREDIPEKASNLVTTASYSMESLLGIINDILDFSKIEDDAIILEHEYFSFTHIMKQVVAEMGVFADRQGIILSFNIADTYQEGWRGDALRVKQILVNFVSNSIKFTPTGHVTIRCNSRFDGEQKVLIFSVEDTGLGMSPELVNSLFDRFSQADSSTTRKFGGTGLGMSINLGLVNLMHGAINVDSELSKGTTITTELLLEDAQPQPSKLTVASQLSAPNLVGKTILLAEDNEINQSIFCAMLEETQATVILANNGVEAIEQYKKVSPDIVFLDIQMPVMDGLTACKAIRALSSTVPLISITANIATDDVRAYSEIGFNYHIGKPVALKELYTLLNIL